MNISEWLSSKKAKTFLVGLGALIGVNFLGMPEETAARLCESIVALVLGGQLTFMGQDIWEEKRLAAEAKGS